jgi:hypothetical protein
MTLGEFVKQLAALLAKKGLPMPFKEERPWHELFYQLKTAPGLHARPAFLERLRFDWDGPYPKSRDLSEFLQALHWNACVSAINPHYTTIELPQDVAKLWIRRYDGQGAAAKSFLAAAVELAEAHFSGPVHAGDA